MPLFIAIFEKIIANYIACYCFHRNKKGIKAYHSVPFCIFMTDISLACNIREDVYEKSLVGIHFEIYAKI